MKVFTSRIIKRILGVAVVLGCSGIFLNGYVGIGEPVHAQEGIQTIGGTSGSASSSSTMGLWQILDMILKIIYLILWPLLVLAGLALDNTLVYASIFHLDAPLWKFWNMMKNFANFALGFMVLFAIIKSILTNGDAGSAKDAKSPLGIIKTTLIAGILIQASWFLVAAVVDISTIATYAVGGLPLSVLKNTNIGTQKILSVNSSIDLNKFDVLSPQGEGFKVWYSTTYKGKPITISPCRIVEVDSGTIHSSYIIGRQFGDPEYNNSDNLNTDFPGYNVCVINGTQMVMWKEITLMDAIKNDWDGLHMQSPTGPYPEPTIPPAYTDKAGYKNYLDTLVGWTGRENKAYVKANVVVLGSGVQEGITKGNEFSSGTTSITIADLIKKSKGFVGPLVTIYSSLLNFAQLTDTSVTTAGQTSGIFLIKSGVAIALFFPLLALAVVLIARIGVLWLYIVASPFIIIKAAFKIPLSGKMEEYLDIKNVMGIIFAPVVTVAALSISLIFMTALVNGFTSSSSREAISETMGIQQIEPISTPSKDYDAVNVLGVTQIEFTKLPWGEGLDRFSWFIVNLFAIGLMWMVVFAAIQSNKLGKSIGGKIESFGKNVFSTLPILPLGEDGARVGIGSAYSVAKTLPDTWMNSRENQQTAQVNKWLDESEGKVTFDDNIANKIISAEGATFKEKYKNAGYTIPDDVAGWSAMATDANKNKIYETIQNNATITDKTAEFTKYNEIFGANWNTAEAIKVATTNIKEKITKGITESNLPAKVREINNNTTAEKTAIIKAYFDANTNASTYEEKYGTNNKLVITKIVGTSGVPDTYTAAAETA